jgi:hypothetical protein
MKRKAISKKKKKKKKKEKRGLWEEKSGNYFFSPLKNGNDVIGTKWILFGLKNI